MADFTKLQLVAGSYKYTESGNKISTSASYYAFITDKASFPQRGDRWPYAESRQGGIWTINEVTISDLIVRDQNALPRTGVVTLDITARSGEIKGVGNNDSWEEVSKRAVRYDRSSREMIITAADLGIRRRRVNEVVYENRVIDTKGVWLPESEFTITDSTGANLTILNTSRIENINTGVSVPILKTEWEQEVNLSAVNPFTTFIPLDILNKPMNIDIVTLTIYEKKEGDLWRYNNFYGVSAGDDSIPKRFKELFRRDVPNQWRAPAGNQTIKEITGKDGDRWFEISRTLEMAPVYNINNILVYMKWDENKNGGYFTWKK